MGFFEKIKNGLTKTSKQFGGMMAAFSGVNEEFFEELEETLIMADLGVETATDTTEKLREVVKRENLRTGEDIKKALAGILVEALETENRELKLETKPSVVLVIGVNGVGKTTTIGKLAMRMKNEGKKVLLCAGDTFRAGCGGAANRLGRQVRVRYSKARRRLRCRSRGV